MNCSAWPPVLAFPSIRQHPECWARLRVGHSQLIGAHQGWPQLAWERTTRLIKKSKIEEESFIHAIITYDIHTDNIHHLFDWMMTWPDLTWPDQRDRILLCKSSERGQGRSFLTPVHSVILCALLFGLGYTLLSFGWMESGRTERNSIFHLQNIYSPAERNWK